MWYHSYLTGCANCKYVQLIKLSSARVYKEIQSRGEITLGLLLRNWTNPDPGRNKVSTDRPASRSLTFAPVSVIDIRRLGNVAIKLQMPREQGSAPNTRSNANKYRGKLSPLTHPHISFIFFGVLFHERRVRRKLYLLELVCKLEPLRKNFDKWNACVTIAQKYLSIFAQLIKDFFTTKSMRYDVPFLPLVPARWLSKRNFVPLGTSFQ